MIKNESDIETIFITLSAVCGLVAFVLQMVFILPKLWELEDRIKRLELDQLHQDEEKLPPNRKVNRTMLDGMT